MSARVTRSKSLALAELPPQSRDECAAWITTLGNLQRNLARLETRMNDQIAAVTAGYQPEIDDLRLKIAAKQRGIQTWAEAHRAEITDGLKSKSANLVTGLLQWRARPPSVSIRGIDTVLDLLAAKGLDRFIRIKREPNKDAMLNEPEGIAGIPGIKIISGVEDFIVTPFEQEAGQ